MNMNPEQRIVKRLSTC